MRRDYLEFRYNYEVENNIKSLYIRLPSEQLPKNVNFLDITFLENCSLAFSSFVMYLF